MCQRHSIYYATHSKKDLEDYMKVIETLASLGEVTTTELTARNETEATMTSVSLFSSLGNRSKTCHLDLAGYLCFSVHVLPLTTESKCVNVLAVMGTGPCGTAQVPLTFAPDYR